MCGGMSRAALATLIGIAGFVAYVAGVVWLADHVLELHWVAQLLYFVVAGILWVIPARRLMLWAAGTAARRPQRAGEGRGGSRRG